MQLEFFSECNEPSVTNVTSYINLGSSNSRLKNEKKIIDVNWSVISSFANADLGRKNEFQTKIGHFDAGVFFLIGQGGILRRCDFDDLNLCWY